jgi:hypothetical protein
MMRKEGYFFDSYEKYPRLTGYRLNVSAGRYCFILKRREEDA